MTETVTGLALLRKEFPPNQISKLPKPKSKDSPKGYCAECGGWHGLPAVHLDYVGHAALTDRLLDADSSWSWEPLAFDDKGLPALDGNGGMWIKLTVCGVTRLGYGDAQGKTGGDAMKERIGDALRNAAMRFGAALDLWHKGDLHAHEADEDRLAARNRWLDEQYALINATKTVGELKRIVDEAVSIAATEDDREAAELIKAAGMTKAQTAKTKEHA